MLFYYRMRRCCRRWLRRRRWLYKCYFIPLPHVAIAVGADAREDSTNALSAILLATSGSKAL